MNSRKFQKFQGFSFNTNKLENFCQKYVPVQWGVLKVQRELIESKNFRTMFKIPPQIPFLRFYWGVYLLFWFSDEMREQLRTKIRISSLIQKNIVNIVQWKITDEIVIRWWRFINVSRCIKSREDTLITKLLFQFSSLTFLIIS